MDGLDTTTSGTILKHEKTKRWLAILLIIALFLFLLFLGFWQLSRADEKRQIEQQIVIANQLKPKVQTKNFSQNEYHKVYLIGQFDNKQQLIYDNQTHQGIAGYYVLTPFNIQNTQKTILVNRGFVPWGNSRQKITDIKIDTDKTKILVELREIKKRFQLQAPILKNTYPLLVQSLDIKTLSKQLKTTISPMLGLLSQNEKNGFIRQWQPFYGSVAKHIGYAVQWFLMAFVLFIIAIRLYLKNKQR